MSPVQLLYECYQDDAYIASKGGIIGFTRALVGEIGIGADGINVNVIAPGETDTRTMKDVNEEIFDLLPTLQTIPGVIQLEDLVGVLSFLCSKDCGFVSRRTCVISCVRHCKHQKTDEI